MLSRTVNNFAQKTVLTFFFFPSLLFHFTFVFCSSPLEHDPIVQLVMKLFFFICTCKSQCMCDCLGDPVVLENHRCSMCVHDQIKLKI